MPKPTPDDDLELDLLATVADDPLVYTALQVAGIRQVEHRLAGGEIVDLVLSNGAAGSGRITMRGPLADLHVVHALIGGALDKAAREMSGPRIVR